VVTELSPAKPTVVVVYDVGSASPLEIVRHVGAVADLIFVLTPSEHAVAVEPIICAFAPAVDWIDAETTAQAVRAVGTADGVVTFSDRRLREASALAAALGHTFHAGDTARLLTDKNAQRIALDAAGLPGPRFAQLRHAKDWQGAVAAVGLPAVLKPTVGEGSIDSYLIDDTDTGSATATRLLSAGDGRTFQLEELLVGVPSGRFGDYVGVESNTVDGVVEHIAITGKFALVPPFRESGQFWPAPVDDATARAARDFTSSALAALGLRNGMTHTELKLTAAGPRIIEVNGRVGGFVNDLALRHLGRDLLAEAALVACRRPLPTSESRTDDVTFQFSSLAPNDTVFIEAVAGVGDVRGVDGVASYHLLVPCPGPLTPGVATQELDLLCGTARDFPAMFALIERAQRTLRFKLRSADGQRRWVAAHELPSAPSTASAVAPLVGSHTQPGTASPPETIR